MVTIMTVTIAGAQIPSSGLMAHWSFNGNANDVSGNAHHGNPYNVVSTTGRLGLPNTAYRFNSLNSFISVPNHNDWNTNNLTICAIMKPDTFYAGLCQGNYIVSRGTVGTSGSFYLTFFDNPYNDCFVSDTNLYVLAGGGGPGFAPVTAWQNTHRVHSGVWYCVVVTFDGSFYRVYVDGTLINTVASPVSQIGSSTDSVCIGKFPWGGASHPYNFKGVLDDVALYNRALSPAEVAQYCNAAILPSDTSVAINQPLSKTVFCSGDTIHIGYQVSNPFNPGNVFTAQLSNAVGSFAAPVAIGNVASSAAGTIICTIPAGTPPGAGYRVRIVASTPVRTSASNTVNLTVNPGIANLTATSNAPVCIGNTINLSANTTTAGVTFSWTGPSGFTSTQQNPTRTGATMAMGGIYTVTALLGTCSQAATTNVIVGSVPATPVAGSNTPVCAGQNINLTASSTTPGVTYSWSGPGGYLSALQNPVRNNATMAMAGTYSVTATSNGCSSPSASTNVVISPSPAAPVATNNGPLCAGVALDLFATGTPGATYQWNGPGSYSSNAQNPTILGVGVAAAGVYTVTQTVGGCTSPAGSTTVVISNSVVPDIVIYPSPNDTVCQGVDVVFVASAVNGGTAPQYQWYKNGSLIPGANGVTYLAANFNSGDYYSCELTSNASCAVPATKMSNVVTLIIISPAPAVVNITANPGLLLSPWQLVTFTATTVMGGVGPSFQWLRNGQPVIGAISNTWGASNLADGDTISVILYSNDPCAVPNTDTSNLMVVHLKTGINEVLRDNDLVIYPSPNNGKFTISNLPPGQIRLEIVNAIGQVVYKEQLKSNGSGHTITADIPAGVYILNLISEEVKKSVVFSVY